MEIRIGVAKVRKYATSESGDTLEIVERPNGGLSVVLADGQTSGPGAKRIANMVVRKVVSLLAEGVRDGAAARAASDYLFTERQGRVQATLNILSVDLQTQTLVVTRNNPAPVVLYLGEALRTLDDMSQPIGLRRNTRPVVSELPLEVGLTVVMYTDGLVHAGTRTGQRLDLLQLLQAWLEDAESVNAQQVADALLAEALRLDQGRPVDDISVVVLHIASETDPHGIRRMSVRLPL